MSTPFSNSETRFAVTGVAQTAAAFSILLNGTVPFSVAAWVKCSSIQDPADILTKPGVFSFGLQGQQLYVNLSGFPPLWSDGLTNPVAQNEWHYVACVYTGTQLQLFIDGNLDCQVGVSGTGTDNANAFLIGNNFQGSLSFVRIYNTALPSGWIMEAMFQPDPAQSYVANFDFTANPPTDISGNNLPLTLAGNTSIDTVAPAVNLFATGYCHPLHDSNVNPGGAGNDAYTIQSWIWVETPAATVAADGSITPAPQAIFVNQSLDVPAGVALFLNYDSTQNLYRLASLRGNVNSPGAILQSLGTVPFAQWVNVAVTYDPTVTTLSLYLNGLLDNSSAAFAAIAPTAAPDLLIGGANVSVQPAMEWTLQGYLQTLDVWSIALSGTQVQQWLSGYPVAQTGLSAHYDFTSHLVRNESNGSTVGLADTARFAVQSAPAGNPTPASKFAQASMSQGGADPAKPYYEQLAPAVMDELRAGISFAGSPNLEKLLDEAMETELSQNLHVFVPAAMVPRFRARLAAEWQRVRHLMRERPLELPFALTYHKRDGEHILIHHTPVRSTVVFRAAVETLDDCTMWRITVIWTVISGLLSVFGVTAALTTRAQNFIEQNILTAEQLLLVINNAFANAGRVTAAGLFTVIAALQSFGVLWPLIKIILTSLGWWALAKLLAKILVKFFGAAAAVAVTIASLIVAVAQLILVLTQQPANCPLIPSAQPLRPEPAR